MTYHQTWLAQSVTAKIKKLLQARKEQLLKLVTLRASDPTISDTAVRIAAIQLKELNETLELIYDTEKYSEAVTKS
jgi:hypothetical protein